MGIIGRPDRRIGQFQVKTDGKWFYITRQNSSQLVRVETTAEAAWEFCALNSVLIISDLDPIEYLLKHGQLLANKYLGAE